jgi:MFS family permease
MGRSFGWLWAAFVASTAGTWLGFGAFPLIAIRVLHSGPAAVSALSAAGLAAGALLAMPLAPWVEARRRRTIMIAADVLRFAALLSVPLCYAIGRLTFVQLVVVSVIGTTANIAFTAAAGAYLKQIVAPGRLLRANARLESTAWTAIAIGPTLGGAAIGVLGPVVTVAANAAGFLLSALGITAIRAPDERPATGRFRPPDWRFLTGDRELRTLFLNTVAVNALVLAAEPLLAVLLLGELGWPPWQYGLAFGLPCLGGLAGARLAARLEARHGRHRVLATVGVLRALWPIGLAFAPPGPAGLFVVITVEFGVITCFGVFNPLMATERLERLPADRLGSALLAWNALDSAAVAVCTAAWGVLAALTTTRVAIGLAGALLVATPLIGGRDGTAWNASRATRTAPAGRRK